MAFKAGAVIGEAILDDSQWNAGSKRVAGSTTDMVKGFAIAQLAVDAFKKVLSVATAETKKAIKNAIDYRETVNKFKVVFGDGTKVISKANKSVQELTKSYGLSKKAATEMLSSTGDLLTGLGFTQDQAIDLSDQVQKLAVDLASFQNIEGGSARASEALTKAILGETEMAKGLGIVIRQGTKEFNDQIKVLMETQGLTEMQAKAQLILTQAMEQSKNAVGDYARTSESLANMQRQLITQQEDISTSLGTILLPVVNNITRAFLDGAKGINDFLSSEQNIKTIQNTIANIAAGFEVFIGIVKDIGSNIFKVLKDSISDIIESFKTLFGDMKVGISVFDVFGGALQIINIGIGVGIKLIKALLQYNIDWINVLKEVAMLLVAVGKGIVNPIKYAKELDSAVVKVGESFKNLGKNIYDNTTDIITDVVDGFKEFPTAAKENGDRYNEIWSEALDKYKYKAEEVNGEIIESEKEKFAESVGASKEWLAKQKEVLGQWDSMQKKTVKDSVSDIRQQRDEFVRYGVEEVEANKWAQKEIRQAWANQAKDTLSTIGSLASQAASIYSSIFETIQMYQQQELDSLKNKHSLEMEELVAQGEARLEQEDMDYQAQQELLNQQLETGVITQEEYDAKTEELQAAHEARSKQITDENKKKEQEEKKKQREKENAKEKEIFEANKANQIAMIWINAAIGIVGAWAQGISQLGPIAGAIVAGVMTAAILAVAIAQCHGKGVKIRMYDNTLKKVEDIKEGDYLLGDDNKPRFVKEIYRGKYHIYLIKYNDYEWTATKNHILSVYNPITLEFKNIKLEEYLYSKNGFYLYRLINNEIVIKKDVTFEYLGYQNFYGFNIDGNQLYRLEDDTITHNTVVVSQQQFIPARAMGGMASGTTRVNELGGEIITLPDGSQVIPNDISQQIANNSGGGKSIIINNNFRGANISDNMSLNNIADQVSMRIARQWELAT